MRKRLKKKLRTCALCKPYKMGWDNRWKAKEAALLNENEKELDIAKKLPLDIKKHRSNRSIVLSYNKSQIDTGALWKR